MLVSTNTPLMHYNSEVRSNVKEGGSWGKEFNEILSFSQCATVFFSYINFSEVPFQHYHFNLINRVGLTITLPAPVCITIFKIESQRQSLLHSFDEIMNLSMTHLEQNLAEVIQIIQQASESLAGIDQMTSLQDRKKLLSSLELDLFSLDAHLVGAIEVEKYSENSLHRKIYQTMETGQELLEEHNIYITTTSAIVPQVLGNNPLDKLKTKLKNFVNTYPIDMILTFLLKESDATIYSLIPFASYVIQDIITDSTKLAMLVEAIQNVLPKRHRTKALNFVITDLMDIGSFVKAYEITLLIPEDDEAQRRANECIMFSQEVALKYALGLKNRASKVEALQDFIHLYIRKFEFANAYIFFEELKKIPNYNYKLKDIRELASGLISHKLHSQAWKCLSILLPGKEKDDLKIELARSLISSGKIKNASTLLSQIKEHPEKKELLERLRIIESEIKACDEINAIIERQIKQKVEDNFLSGQNLERNLTFSSLGQIQDDWEMISFIPPLQSYSVDPNHFQRPSMLRDYKFS